MINFWGMKNVNVSVLAAAIAFLDPFSPMYGSKVARLVAMGRDEAICPLTRAMGSRHARTSAAIDENVTFLMARVA